MSIKNKSDEFLRLCEIESYRSCGEVSEGIGIYNEKRLHRVLKRTVCDDEDRFEVKVGKYVADVLCDGRITEIQCGPLLPLRQKLEYYLASTEHEICVIHPLVSKKRIIRAERESGEILRMRASAKKEDRWSALAALYPVRELLGGDRIEFCFPLIEVEEYRFSEKQRYRKKGAYDSESFPVALEGELVLRRQSDFLQFIPSGLAATLDREGRAEFSASDFAPYTSLRGRDVYSALNVLSATGVIERKKEGRSVKYLLK